MSATMIRPRPMPEKPKKKAPLRFKERLRHMSPKRAEQEYLYRDLKQQFLGANRMCQFPDCLNRSTQLHHKNRRGIYLCDVRFFCALCVYHHRYLHDHPKEARRLGLLV